MKYLDEFSDPELAGRLVDQIKEVTTRRWAIMEVCGGQTHSIIRHGIDQLLPDEIEKLLEKAASAKSHAMRLADRAARVYAPVVHLTAALTCAGSESAGVSAPR